MTAEDIRPPPVAAPLARPGHNCWRVVQAERFAVLVDGSEYYPALKHALLGARHSILFLGWEFDSRTRLVRGRTTTQPDEIGPLLDHLARTRPGLSVRVLIWDSALIYAINREFAGFVKMDLLTHRGLHFRLDDSHPVGASHHQKIVVVDESLAFVGGLDVSSQRWDSRAHCPADPHRSDPAALSYPPFHDAMAVVTGAAAGALADICRERWRCSAGEILHPVPPIADEPLWPPWLPVLMQKVPVVIARTAPPWDGGPPVHEVEQLYVDMIGAARRFIYIENQYFASRRIAAALAARLAGDNCPEILVVNPGEPISVVERSTMGVARARLAGELARLDRRGRLRLVYPCAQGHDIKVHSKLMIVDDCWLRIGSANLNNRSMGLDTECDVMVEAGEDAALSLAMRALRHDLLAEHLGASVHEVAAAEASAGTLFGAVNALSGRAHTLMPVDCSGPGQVVQLLVEGQLADDPEGPLEPLLWGEENIPGPAPRPIRGKIWALAALLAVLSVAASLGPWEEVLAWIRGLQDYATHAETWVLTVGIFALSGLLRVPLPLPVLLTSAALGPWAGASLSLVGGLVSAALVHSIGRTLGRGRVRRLAGWRVHRVNRALARHGILAILVLRLLPVASFSVVNLVCGASGVRFRNFIIGTLVGLAPGILAISVLGDRLLVVLRTPSPANIALLAVAVILVMALQWGVMKRLARARLPLGGGRA